RGQIILLDFGLAKGQAGDISRATTSASIFGYTPNYAPLEQIQGLGTDARSDLYALGATLYHLMTGVKPPDALTRAAALVNGHADPLVPATAANPAVPPQMDTFLAKAMAQNREQRYATATEMRRDLHASSDAATVVNRGEAQTMLFPPGGASTVAIPTETVVRQETVRAGDTTVVRPLPGGRRRASWPLIISAAALTLLVGGVLAFVGLRDRGESRAVDVAPSPSPVETQATNSPTVAPTPEDEAEEQAEAEEPKPETPVAKNPEKNTRSDEAAKKQRKAETDAEAAARAEAETQSHEEVPQVDPQVPDQPVVPGGVRPRRPQTIVMPGGMTIRTFPDGSQLITSPDGKRVFVTPDGKRQVFNPQRRPPRRAAPSPSP
ncbi:MAG TPA: hypothetical protein VFS77_21405, partial [Pyrinomonadaceae bacterium]|nr:hypothetical protein [Pyrinomonadaceae bacterium]